MSGQRLRRLVENGRVHSDVYTSEQIFKLEIENIFHRCWLYIGHESEIPNRGDYRLRTMGRQPVIMVRGHDGHRARLREPLPSPRRHCLPVGSGHG